MHHVIRAWAEKAPAEAAVLVAQNGDKPWARRAIGHVAQIWIQDSPAEASAWLATLPADDGTAQAIQIAVQQLARRSTADAVHWAKRMSGVARDYALLGLVSAGTLPVDESASLANSVDSPEQRYQAFRSLLFRVAHAGSSDRSVRDILAGADLAPEQQQQLIEELTRMQGKHYGP